MELEDQIKSILERELPGVRVEVERDPDTSRVGGRVIWDGFAGYSSLRRQNRIFSLLRRNLGGDAARVNISYLFAYTTKEY